MTNNCELPTLDTTASHADILKYSAVYRIFHYLQTAFDITVVRLIATISTSYLWASDANTNNTSTTINNNIVFLLVYAWYTQLDYGKL